MAKHCGADSIGQSTVGASVIYAACRVHRHTYGFVGWSLEVTNKLLLVFCELYVAMYLNSALDPVHQ